MSNRFGSLKSRALMTSSAAVLGVALAGSFGSVAWAQQSSAQEIAVTASKVTLHGNKVSSLIGSVASADNQVPSAQSNYVPSAQSNNAAPSTPPTQEIVVTGSRIVRRDYTSASPIVTLNSQTFENSSSASIETNLNKLPQFTQAIQSQFTAGDVQNTTTNTPGSANISLRGLGPNRNLVLIDGRRAMPTNGAMLVDVNTIPAAMVDSVEIITGGASAVYGADAISGVANFKLKKNYQGFTFDSQYGLTQLSDDKEFRASALIGGNFADDKGNATLALEHYTRSDAPQANRDFYKKGWADPTVAGTDFWPTDTYYNPAPFGVCVIGACPSQTTVDGIFNAVPPGSVPAGALFMVNQGDGTLYTGMPQFGGNGVDSPNGAYRYTGPIGAASGYRVVTRQSGPAQPQAFKVNEPLDNTSVPLTRYSAFATAHYDLNDWLTVFSQAQFSQIHTHTILAFSPAVNGWGVNIPHGSDIYAPSVSGGVTAPGYGPGGAFGLNCAGPVGCTNSEVFPTPLELTALLDSRIAPGFGADGIPGTGDDPGPGSGANLPWQMSRNLNFLPQRATDNNNTTWQVTAGFDGKVPGTDWTWELFAQHGRSEELTQYQGFASLEGYRAIVLSPNYGKNAKIVGNSNPATNPGQAGFAAGNATCTSGLPIFGTGSVSADCVAAILAPLQNQTALEQNVVEFDIQGGLFDDWAGNVRYALGASYRDDRYNYIQDNLDTQNDALNSTLGLFPSNNTFGYTASKEVYGEMVIPLLSNLPLVKNLELEPGYRYSYYNTVGGVNTYKILADWDVTDWLKIRGGFNRATRAPNIGELFQAPAQQVAFATYADPCSLNSAGVPTTFGTTAADPAQAAAALSVCKALMGAGAAAYYGTSPDAQPLNTGFSLALPNVVGNPNVGSEVAKTWTVGTVIKSPFNAPLLNRTSLSVDWYSIKLDGLIASTSQDQVYQNCLSLATNPTSDPTTSDCRAIIRDQVNGAVSTVNTSYVNTGGFITRGIDVQLDWAADLADMFGKLPGTLSVNVLYNYLQDLSVAATKGGRFTRFAGTLGPNLGGLNAPAFKYKVYTTVSYAIGPASVQVRWQHLPQTDPLPASSPTAFGPNDYDEFDLSGRYSINDNITMRAGIDNVLDVQPQVTAKNTSAVIGVHSSGNGTTLPGIYDVLGRRFYAGVTLKY
ncbi:MAG: TonB-dependent receptor [Alphaproteobacteria bacterium]